MGFDESRLVSGWPEERQDNNTAKSGLPAQEEKPISSLPFDESRLVSGWPDDEPQMDTTQPDQERGFMGDVGTAVAGGLYDLVEMGLRGVRALPGGPVSGGVDPKQQKTPGFLDRAISGMEEFQEEHPFLQTQHTDSGIGNAIREGARSAVTSLGTAIPTAAAGFAFGGPAGALLGGLVGYVSGAPLFGLAEYDSFVEQGLNSDAYKQGRISKEQIEEKAMISGLAEGGIEFAANALEAATLGGAKALTIPGKQALKNGVKSLMKEGIKARIGRMAANVGFEVGGEMLTGGIQAEQYNAINETDQSFIDGAKEAFGPSFVASMIFLGVGEAGVTLNRKNINKKLEDANVDPRLRQEAVSIIANDIRKVSPDDADIWQENALAAVAQGQPINTDEAIVGVQADEHFENLRNLQGEQAVQDYRKSIERKIENIDRFKKPSETQIQRRQAFVDELANIDSQIKEYAFQKEVERGIPEEDIYEYPVDEVEATTDYKPEQDSQQIPSENQSSSDVSPMQPGMVEQLPEDKQPEEQTSKTVDQRRELIADESKTFDEFLYNVQADTFEQELKKAQSGIKNYKPRPPIQPDVETLRKEWEASKSRVDKSEPETQVGYSRSEDKISLPMKNLIGQESDSFDQFQEDFRDQKIDEFEQNLQQAQADIKEYPDRPPIQSDAEGLLREYENQQSEQQGRVWEQEILKQREQARIKAQVKRELNSQAQSIDTDIAGHRVEKTDPTVIPENTLISEEADITEEAKTPNIRSEKVKLTPGDSVTWQTKAGKTLSGKLVKKNKNRWSVQKIDGKNTFVLEKDLISGSQKQENDPQVGLSLADDPQPISDYSNSPVGNTTSEKIIDKPTITDQAQIRFIENRVKKLGSVEAVDKEYAGNDKVSEYARWQARQPGALGEQAGVVPEAASAETENNTPPATEPGAPSGVTSPQKKGRNLFTEKELSEFDRLGVDVSNVTEQYKTEALQQLGFQQEKETDLNTPGYNDRVRAERDRIAKAQDGASDIKTSKGNPWKSKVVLDNHLKKKGMADTHEAIAVDGGFVGREKTVDDQNNKKNEPSVGDTISLKRVASHEQTATPENTGSSGTTYLNDNTSIDFNYEVIDADELITSHNDNMSVNPDFPAELQPRERSRKASLMQVENMASKLNPARLGESANVAQGAPMVGKDSNIVESGNGRTLAIRKAYAGGKTGSEYKVWLQKNAELFGLTVDQVKAIKEPVLVRRRQTDIDNLSRFTQQANEADTAKLSSTEQAIVDAGNLSSDDLAMFRPDQDGNLMAATNKGFIDLFLDKMSPEERAGYVTEDGRANKQLIDRVQAAVFQKAYGSEELLKLSAEEANPDIKNILNGLTKGAPNFVKARGLDDNLAGTGIVEDIVGGIELLRRAQREYPDIKAGNGRTALQAKLRQTIDQGDLFGSDPSEEVKIIAQLLADNIRSGKRIGEFFDSMGVRLRAYIADLSQAEMFGTTNELTSKDLIETTKEFLNDKYEDRQQSLFEEPTDQKRSPGRKTGDIARGDKGRDEDSGRSGRTEDQQTKQEITPTKYGERNKVFTKEGADKARELLRKKLSGNQLNSGIDPEIMLAGIQLAGYHIEAGARTFTAYSKAMVEDVGETIKPYLRSFYEGVRHYPEFDSTGMDDVVDLDATPKSQRDTVEKSVNDRIDDKYADILSLPENLTGPEILDKIDEGTLTPRQLDKFLEKSNSLEEDIQAAKAAVADRVGDLKETYRYESEKEGEALEKYLDSLLAVLSKDRVPGSSLSDQGATAKDGETARKVPDGSGISQPLPHKQKIINDIREGEVRLKGKLSAGQRKSIKEHVEKKNKELEKLEILDPLPNDLDYQKAYDAHRGTSHVPDERAEQEQAGYVQHMKSVRDYFLKRIKPEQEGALKVELEQYKQGYLKKYGAVLDAKSKTMSSMITGAARFPTTKNQKALDAEQRRYEELQAWDKKAQNAIKRNLDLSGVISSDDPKAVDKLSKKLADLEAAQEMMKSANRITRAKKKTDEQKIEELAKLGIKEKDAKNLLEPDYAGKVGFPAYALSNNNANIKRTRDRIAELEKQTNEETTQIDFDGGQIIDNVEDNRVQIFHEEKPSEDIRGRLKKNGFRWAPSVGAWQRKRSDPALWAAKDIVGVEEDRSKYSTTTDHTPGQGITLDQIKSQYKNQQITTNKDGTLSIQFTNGKGVKIETVNHIGGNDIRIAIESGRMEKNGVIQGKYQNGTITINLKDADRRTPIHENYHALREFGMVSVEEERILNNIAKNLDAQNKFKYKLQNDVEENASNALAQIVDDRKQYQEGSKVRAIIQKVMDFFDALTHIGRQSARKLAREYESENIYSRDVNDRQATNQVKQDASQFSVDTDTIPIKEKEKTYDQILSGMKNVWSNRKNKGAHYKEDIGVIENLMGLMSHYSEKIPALKRTFDELLKRSEWKFQKENELYKNGDESMVGTLQDLQKQNKAAYAQLKKYLIDRDINQIGAILIQDEDGTWTIKSPKNERTGERSVLEEGILTKKKARVLAIQYEIDEYPDPVGRDALRAFRTMTVNLHDFYAESWESIIQEYEDRGLTIPDVVTRTEGGEVRINLKVALSQMGDRSSYYFPRQRSNGDWRILAKKEGEHDFIEYRDFKKTADFLAGKMKSKGYTVEVEKVGSMSEDVYQNVKSILSTQAMVNQALAETKLDTKLRKLEDLGLKGEWRGDDYVLPNGGVYAWSESVLKKLGGQFYSDKGRRGNSWSPGYRFDNAPKDMHEIVTNALFMAQGQETDISFEIAQSIANQLADDLRARGSRARMISRSDAVGKDVPVGYETDPVKAIAQAINSAAGGFAKQQVALNTSKAITGQHYTWNEWQEQHPDYKSLKMAEEHLETLQKNSKTEEERIVTIDQKIKELQRERVGVKTESEASRQDRLFRIGTLFREKEKILKWKDKDQAAATHQEIARLRGNIHKEYRQYIQDNMIDPKRQKRAYTDAVNAVENVLKNDEAGDRVVNTLKGLASVWFLGGRLSSAAVNITAMGTTVPAAMNAYGGVPLKRTATHIVQAGKAYASFVTGKGNVSKNDRAILEEIFSRGWVAAQLNMETVNALKSGPAQKYGRAVELLMTPFKITEEFNRGTTLLAAYKGIMAENPGMSKEDALSKAKTVSDRAHGIYGAENQPALLRKGRGLRAASAMYIFQTFMHNYFTTMAYMIGRRQAAAATYMILSPMVFGGAASSILLPAVKMIFKAMDEDDPEEKIYQVAESLFGETGGDVARYGLPGLAGINLKGSLAPNLPDIQEPLDLLGPIGGMMRNIYQGGQNLTQGNYLKGLEKITPLAAGNVVKAIRETTDGVTTRSGDPVFFGNEQLKGNLGSGIMRAAGLNPIRLSKPREIKWNETTLMRQYSERKRRIYSRIVHYHAKPGKDKNPEEWQDIVDEVLKFNARVKSNGLTRIMSPITPKTIKSRVRRAFRPNKRERMRVEN